MPIEVENKLKARARKKGFKGKRFQAYVYGTMNKQGLLESIHPRLVELSKKIDLGEILFGDPRPRNSLGEYTSDPGEGVDPNQMAAAYGPPEVSQSHIERIKRFFGKRRQVSQQPENA